MHDALLLRILPGQLDIHLQKYGSFGITFSKHFLLQHGAIPVHYVPRNASNRGVGIGPRTFAERFERLQAELQRIRFDLDEYVARIDGAPTFLAKLPSPNTPAGHQLLGRFSPLQTKFEELVFARMKFFTAELPQDHDENFYMEREWRLHDGLSFGLADIARIFLPRDYCHQFHEDIPDYTGPVHLVGRCSQCGAPDSLAETLTAPTSEDDTID